MGVGADSSRIPLNINLLLNNIERYYKDHANRDEEKYKQEVEGFLSPFYYVPRYSMSIKDTKSEEEGVAGEFKDAEGPNNPLTTKFKGVECNGHTVEECNE